MRKRWSSSCLSVAATAILSCGCQSTDPSVAPVPRAVHDVSAQLMSAEARALIDSLSPRQREQALRPFDDDAGRTTWSNLPASIVPREGLRLGDLDDRQRRLVQALLRASTSSQGYLKMAGILQLDERLGREAALAVERGTRRLPEDLIASWTSANYWVRIFGDPATSTWGWQLSGHHLGANFTVVDGAMTLTPTFLGAEPNVVAAGNDAGFQVLGHEADRGMQLLLSLSDAQRAKAVLGEEVPGDVLTGPGRKDALATPEGLPASELDAAQQVWLWRLIDEYVGNANPDAADAHLAEIRGDGLDVLRFAWFGPTDDPHGRYYYRVHGPSLLIEYVVERGVGGSAANHVHSIVRHPDNDYGADWLHKHYEEHHPERRRRR